VLRGAAGLHNAALAAFAGLGLSTKLGKGDTAPGQAATFLLRMPDGRKVEEDDWPLVRAHRASRTPRRKKRRLRGCGCFARPTAACKPAAGARPRQAPDSPLAGAH
jgi:hypothetical protein